MHRWQKEFFKVFDEGMKRFFWLNWHRRARKTTCGLNLLIRECCMNANRTYDYVGPTYKQSKSIVWRDPNMLNIYLPSFVEWVKNESELFVRFPNNTYLNIRGADNPDSLRGTNAHGVFFDEWALIDPAVWMEVYRPIIAQDPTRWAIFGFTPKGQNHAFEGINRAKSEPDSFVSTLSADISGLIPQNELEKAKREMPPELFQQEFMCSFVAEEELSFITSAALENLKDILHTENGIRSFIAIDPAVGGDECVAKAFRNQRETDMRVWHHRDAMRLVTEIQLFAEELKTKNILVEVDGLGSVIADRLNQLGYTVYKHRSGGEPLDKELFANKKAEIWWEVSKRVRDLKCDYPEDMKTRQQISSVKYRIQGGSGRMICEPKELTKKRIGCSPDRADAWVMAQYYWNWFEPDSTSGNSRSNAVTVPSCIGVFNGI